MSKTKKMQKILHTLLLLAFISSSISLTSCLKDDDEDIIRYSDCAITSFSLGTLNKYTKTISSKTGNDTIVKTTITGSAYKFTIDQKKHEIYNVDSLPLGTDSLHVICNIGTKNGGYVNLRSAVSDSIFNYDSKDSISFKWNPRKFLITSNDGKNTATYTVKLNIHKEDAAKMTWNAPYTVSEFTGAEHLQTTEMNGSLFVKVAKGGDVKLYTSAIGNGKTWNAITPDTKLSPTANIAAYGNMLYTTDEVGNICKSVDDGAHWETVGSLTGKVLGISNKNLYYLSEGNINAYNTIAGTAAAEQYFGISTSPFLADSHISLCEATKSKKVTGTSIIGTTGNNTAVLYKAENTAEQQKWMALSNESGQDLPNSYSEVVPYGEFLLAIAGSKFYTSLDYGRSWQQRYYVHTPTSLNANEESHLFADSRGILWIITNGQVYTGKLNGIAWER